MNKNNTFICDFETTTVNTNFYKKYQTTKVQLWFMKNLNATKEFIGVNLNEWLETFKTFKNKKTTLYFHNLSFDGDFILKYLSKKHFKAFVEDFSIKPRANTFCFLRQGISIYFIKFYILNKWDKLVEIKIYCSLKLLSVGVETLGKFLKIEKHNQETKQVNFYDIDPQDNLSQYTKSYIDYIKRDTEIVRLSFLNFLENKDKIIKDNSFLVDFDLEKYFTIGSVAYKLQQAFVKHYSWQHFNQKIYRGLKIDLETYKLASLFYFGGMTQFNPKTQYNLIECKKGISLDVNSMHPSSMIKHLPYGKLYNFNNVCPNKNNTTYLEYWEIHIESAIIKNPNFICLWNWNKKDNKDKNRYVKNLFDFKCYYLKDEFKTLQKFYHFEGVKILNKYWAFSKPFLKDYVEYLYQFKENYTLSGDKANAQTYKILLNSSYGKHATRLDFDNIYACNDLKEYQDLLSAGEFIYKKKRYNIKKVSDFQELENQYLLKISPIETKQDKLFNKLIASTITAYSRIYIYESIYKMNVDNFLYCDTDSIYLSNYDNLNKLKIDKSKLGYWGVENEFKYFISKGAKCYAVGDNPNFSGDKKITFSGVNKNWLAKNFNLGFYETEEIILKEANLKQIHTPDGLALIWKDYTSKKRYN